MNSLSSTVLSTIRLLPSAVTARPRSRLSCRTRLFGRSLIAGRPPPRGCALVLGRAAPDAMKLPGSQRECQAFAPDPAGRADRLGFRRLLAGRAGSRDREEQLGIGRPAGSSRPPFAVGDARRCPRLLGPRPAFGDSSHQLASSPPAVAQSVTIVIIQFTVPGPERHSRRRLWSHSRQLSRAQSITRRGCLPASFIGGPIWSESRYLLCRKDGRASRISLVRVIAVPPFFMSPPGAGRCRAIGVRSWSVPRVRVCNGADTRRGEPEDAPAARRPSAPSAAPAWRSSPRGSWAGSPRCTLRAAPYSVRVTGGNAR